MYICIYSTNPMYIYEISVHVFISPLRNAVKPVSSTFWGVTVSHCMIISIYSIVRSIYPIKWLVSSQCLMGNLIRMIVITIIIGVNHHHNHFDHGSRKSPICAKSLSKCATNSQASGWENNEGKTMWCVSVFRPKPFKGFPKWQILSGRWRSGSTIGSESRPMLFRQTQVWLRPLDLWL